MNKRQLLEEISAQREGFLSFNQIVKLAGKELGFNTVIIKKMLNELLDDGSLVLTERNKYATLKRAGVVRGAFVSTSKGYGFVIPEDKTIEDIFIPERKVNGAVLNDKVLAKIVPRNRMGRRFDKGRNDDRNAEGEIIRIVKRSITQIVGTFQVYTGGGLVIPDDKRFADQVFVGIDKTMGATTNQKVVVKIVSFPSRTTMAMGEVVEILGDINELGVDTLSIVRSFGLTEEFPVLAKEEAVAVAKEPTAKDKQGRKDFTKELTITIDGEDARDFDDAISLVKDKDDYLLSVHIADVSNYVALGGEIDKEAYLRATSVYFPDMVLPMLPEELSNNVCSLNPNVERLTLSVEARFDQYGNVKNYQICNGVIKSKYRMTYTKVAKILDRDKATCQEYKEIVPMLYDMESLAKLLLKRRETQGELDFDLPEVQVIMDDQQKIVDIVRKPRTMADRLIEQFMVITNEIVAKYAKEIQLPFVYRVHEIPTPERMKSFNDFISGIGMNLSIQEIEPKPRDVQKVLKAVKGKPMQVVVNSILLRSMQKARYYELPLGHFGLALADYCHFTSPIRRYPDLTIHRIIKDSISGKLSNKKFDFYDEYVGPAALQSSEREKLADDAERAVDDLKKAEFMSKKIGQEFVGFVSGVTENGIFVQLDNTIEGMVQKNDLPQDKYYYDEQKWAMIGKNNSFRLGQTLKIKVDSVNLLERKINFALAEDWKIVEPQTSNKKK